MPIELVVKAVHVMAVIAWMAGLFYLPRLFVYHAEADEGSGLAGTFMLMERRLLRVIMGPAMAVAWIAGLVMLWLQDFTQFSGQAWMWIKLVGVIAMSAFHGRLAFHQRQFERGVNEFSGRYFRLLNEVPTVLMIVIVTMVIVRPF